MNIRNTVNKSQKTKQKRPLVMRNSLQAVIFLADFATQITQFSLLYSCIVDS
ncbi:hypothetical protein X874_18690 [Mannheimia varigena USDA-ARS-USMARC-1312]|nr:hypothetical protein X874_18690 [Mannheimia varigena USDA-ARS-USMARC-1312]